MIEFRDWTLDAPHGALAHQYDNLSRNLVVHGDLPGGFDWAMLVDVDGRKNIIALLPVDDETVGCALTANMLPLSGHYKMQLRGTMGDVVRHTNSIIVFVPGSIIGDGQWPEVTSEFRQLERSSWEAANAAREAHDGVEAARDDAAANAKVAKLAQDGAEAAQRGAEEAENQAEGHSTAAGQHAADAEESAHAADESERTATQALADLLRMLGEDIAPLVAGKLPMSVIPATATQEIYEVASADELVGLTAQRGDLAELVELVDGERTITKTWQLLGNNPAVSQSWVVWGTSYAVQAGSASQAAQASNAATINGHRLVEMTYEQYETAVIDPDTYYLVYAEAVGE